MKQEIEITVPTDWSAITLRKYLQLQKDIETYKDNDEAVTAALFYHLCGVDAPTVHKLDIQTFTNIQLDLTRFISQTELPLQQFIKIGGVEYGFEPNLSQMSYGAYVDLGKNETMGINEKWAEAMSILYRPVTKKIGASYQIEKYIGKIDGEKFMDVDMSVHFGALSFFFHLLGDLQSATLKFLTDSEEIPTNILTTLERNGKLIPQSSSSVVMI
jgi:hypothetical protein